MTSGLKIADTQAFQRLESWKHIASYLNCNERTAKRWEVTRKLPIRRLPGARGGVFALVHELEAWQMGASDPIGANPDVTEEHSIQNLNLEQTSAENKDAESTFAALEISSIAAGESPTAAKGRARNQYQGAGRFGRANLGSCRRFSRCNATARFRWQIAAGIALFLVLTASFTQLHRTAQASRREITQYIPSPAARELYLQGRFYWNKRTPQDLKVALASFQKAIALDPQYAPAYAGIADCYGLSTEYAALPAAQAYPLMLAAAQKAIALDPNLASAHRALGFVLFYWNWDRAAAEREFLRAIELNPDDATTHHWYANVLQQSQEFPAAMKEMEKARELDPAAPSILADRGLALSASGRSYEGRLDWLQLEKTDAAYLPPHWYLAEAYLRMHDAANYLDELKTIAAISHCPNDIARSTVAHAAYLRGKEPAMLNALADFEVHQYNQHHISAMRVAFSLSSANRNREALDYVQRAYKDRDPIFLVLGDRSHLPAIADTPEYQSLQAKSRLPYPVM